MQSETPYLEGDSYYDAESAQVAENTSKVVETDNTELEINKEHEELIEQLQKTEDEITTLRQVLTVKLKLSQDLKRQLGITAIGEMKGDLISGINALKDSNTYKATSDAMKSVKEKTSTTISTASTKVTQKLGLLRNSNAFKSIEGRVGNAYSSVKTKLVNSKSTNDGYVIDESEITHNNSESVKTPIQ